MHPAAGVFGVFIGMVGTPGAAGVGEDQDTLFIVHVGLRVRQVAGAGTFAHLHDAIFPNQTKFAARHLGHGVGAEVVQYLIERGRHGRQPRQMLDHGVAFGLGGAVDHRIALPSNMGREHSLPSSSE